MVIVIGLKGFRLASSFMARLVASLFGAGLLLRKVRGADAGSGTVGGMLALAVALLVDRWWGRLAALTLAVAVGWWSVKALDIKDSDPAWVVVDEAAGTFLSTLGLGAAGAVAGFVAFRLADIKKSWFPGVARAEMIGGPTGVLADDLVAGLYGLAVGWLVQSFLP